MSGLDMSEAVRMLANEKNISVDTLLHVLVDAATIKAQIAPWLKLLSDIFLNLIKLLVAPLVILMTPSVTEVTAVMFLVVPIVGTPFEPALQPVSVPKSA